MAGASITITSSPGAQQTIRALAKLSSKVQDLRKPFNVIGKSLILTHYERFQREVSPSGVKWAFNADSTILNYARKHGGFTKNKKGRGAKINKKGIRRIAIKKILRDSGTLQDTFVYQSSPQMLRFGTSSVTSDYAAVHQFGSAKKNIPARPFLGLTVDDQSMIRNELKQYILSQWALT